MFFGGGRRQTYADWGISHLPGTDPEKIVDLCCGGGRNTEMLLRIFPGAQVTAVDPSPFAVEKATNRNRDWIAARRCIVQREFITDLHLDENAYDLAAAFGTVYEWPDLKECFTQVRKILRPGGSFLIVNDIDGKDAASIRLEKMNEKMTCCTIEQLEEALYEAGFSKIRSDHHPKESWITVLAEKI